MNHIGCISCHGSATVAAVALWVVFAMPAGAHHSGAAFDQDVTVAVTGMVTKVEWLSPHARLYVDALDGDGETVSWEFELPSPNTLMRRGWSRSSLSVGDSVQVSGFRARNHPYVAVATGVVDASGKRLFSGLQR